MIDTIYVEEAVASHPRAQRILERFPAAVRVPCGRYGEVFNRRAQSFRLQKRGPSLILAQKLDGHVLPVPRGYGLGSQDNYYFSPTINCLYDCRYCFLRGMMPSAHLLVFVNHEDFAESIGRTAREAPGECTFFAGYDSDPLALDATCEFLPSFLPLFEGPGRGWMEVRTKSVRLRPLLERPAAARVIVAFSLAPPAVARALERGAPPVERRIEALAQLAEHGWALGLRFDPLIHFEGYRAAYEELFAAVFAQVPAGAVHSVSFGPLRFPKNQFERMVKLYPDDPLLAGPLVRRGDVVTYPQEVVAQLMGVCRDGLSRWVDEGRLFACGEELG